MQGYLLQLLQPALPGFGEFLMLLRVPRALGGCFTAGLSMAASGGFYLLASLKLRPRCCRLRPPHLQNQGHRGAFRLITSNAAAHALGEQR